LAELLVPEPGGGQVLLKVAAAALNRADLLQAEGRYPPPKGAPETLGMEVSGTIAAVGAGVKAWREGDEVCALLPGGGYAEYALASELCVLPVPKGAAFLEAAGLPEAFFTVWANVINAARLQPGETFLVHGGSSGIGVAAIQLMAARGHRVFTTAGSAEKCAVCVKLGAARATNYHTVNFVAAVMAGTDNKGVDVILDMVGGDYVQRNLEALAFGGRLVNIAYQKGARVEVDFRIMQARHLSMMASGLRFRSNEEKGRIRDAVFGQVWPLIEKGRIRAVIDSVFPLAEAQKAHARMRESGHIGKILLKV
jgi:putative PIG3 family NAD(P)H quinone oxidoreductase